MDFVWFCRESKFRRADRRNPINPSPSERRVALVDCLSLVCRGPCFLETHNEWFTPWTSLNINGWEMIHFIFGVSSYFWGAILLKWFWKCMMLFFSFTQVEIATTPDVLGLVCGNSIQQFKRKAWRQKDSSWYVLRQQIIQTRKQTCLTQDVWKPVT